MTISKVRVLLGEMLMYTEPEKLAMDSHTTWHNSLRATGSLKLSWRLAGKDRDLVFCRIPDHFQISVAYVEPQHTAS